MKAQCAAVLLAHCSLSVSHFLVKNTNSDTNSVESTQLAEETDNNYSAIKEGHLIRHKLESCVCADGLDIQMQKSVSIAC